MAPRSRPYRQRKRAEQHEKTRRRITEAIVDLHRTVGPAKTTVTDIAERAGVTRMTVYNHFPEEADLIEACSAHWVAANPFPDPAAWAAIADPPARLRTALADLYAWYRRTAPMMGNVLRDAPLVPALDAVLGASWEPYLDGVVGALARGWSRRKELRAALRLAVDFATWRTLTQAGGKDAAAAALMARMVACA